MKIVVYNLGCKVNQYECDSLVASFEKAGHTVSCELEAADLYVINTCAVTQEAEKKSRQCIARMRKYNPNAKIYVTGCAAQKNPEQFEGKGVTHISGVAGKNLICSFPEGKDISPLPSVYENSEYGKATRSRAFIKVQDGCNNFCSYCIIPYLRGRIRSRMPVDVLTECNIRALETDEIVLTGINLSAYGKDIGLSLADLIIYLSGVKARIRLGSLEVNVIDKKFLSAMAKAGNVCPHFHLSLQSGDDGVLKDMNRHYTRKEYMEKVDLIREYFPDAGITTDIIVGFPTETEEAFANTLDLAEKVQFSDIHIFPYSRRQGTKAYSLGSIDRAVVDARIEKLEKLRHTLRRNFLSTYCESEFEVVAEYATDFYIEGYTDNYIRVYISKTATPRIGRIYRVRATGIYQNGLLAKLK